MIDRDEGRRGTIQVVPTPYAAAVGDETPVDAAFVYVFMCHLNDAQ